MPVKHLFVSAKGDGGDATLVRPSNWNADHSIDATVTSTSTNLTLDATHEYVRCTAGAGGITITLPAVSGLTGRRYQIKRVDVAAGNVVIDGNGTETIDGELNYTLVNQWQYVVLLCTGSAWEIVGSN